MSDICNLPMRHLYKSGGCRTHTCILTYFLAHALQGHRRNPSRQARVGMLPGLKPHRLCMSLPNELYSIS